MKILSITAQKPHSTGSGTYLTELVKAFDALGHQQAVIAGVYADDAVSFPEGVQFFPVTFGNNQDIEFPIAGMSDIMPYVSTKYPEMTPEQIDIWSSAFKRVISEVVEGFDPDIILCHHLFLLTSMIREMYPDRKVLGISHGSDIRQTISCSHLQDIIKPGIAALDCVFCLHEIQRDQIINLYGVAPERVIIIGSGYNSTLFNTNGRLPRHSGAPVRICFAGKMSLAKGVNELIAALKTVIENGYNIKVTLAGGCQEDCIRQQLDSLPEEVDYIGMVPQIQLAEIFRNNDIFVLPSYYEGLSLVLIEAMASGLIPIFTDIPGTRPWVDSNVRNPNIRYIPRPEMASVDEPTESGKIEFKSNLIQILEETIDDIVKADASGASLTAPDTSDITWQAVANKIANFI